MNIGALLDSLRQELNKLDREFRQEIPKKIQIARELGDLSESGEYETIKDRQGFVKARMSFLQQRIAEISKINLSAVPKDRVAVGSTVHLVDEESGEESVYTLVFPELMDSTRGLISVASPVGRSLIGKQPGDRVVMTTPGGTKAFEMMKLLTLHENLQSTSDGTGS